PRWYHRRCCRRRSAPCSATCPAPGPRPGGRSWGSWGNSLRLVVLGPTRRGFERVAGGLVVGEGFDQVAPPIQGLAVHDDEFEQADLAGALRFHRQLLVVDERWDDAVAQALDARLQALQSAVQGMDLCPQLARSGLAFDLRLGPIGAGLPDGARVPLEQGQR